jgi:hypothetical protein
MKSRPRMTQCHTGLKLRRSWAQGVQDANMQTWQHRMFAMHPYWKHVQKCSKCQMRIKARQGEIV